MRGEYSDGLGGGSIVGKSESLPQMVLGRRREWFARPAEAMTALWWVPAGVRPTVAEAEHRLRLLRAQGPTAEAFTLRETFPAPVALPRG